MCKRVIASEYVSYGHPDKIADQISDAILDAFLEKDPNTRAGIETMVKDNIVVLGGEINSETKIDYDSVVRKVYSQLPFPKSHHLAADDIKIINLIGKQSPEIHQGVDKSKEVIGAGDQGFCVGYASNETDVYIPLGHYIAKKICFYVANRTDLEYGPDTKSQVIVEYDDEKSEPKVLSILVSTMHQDNIDNVRHNVRKMITSNLVGMDKDVFNKYINGKDIKIDVNPCGEWKIGGPVSDCGVTGRKIVVDQYGGYCNVGGGAFCVDGDTEYIGEDLKWHKISEYKDGKVGQWNNGMLEFVRPLKYHNTVADKMYRLTKPNHLDMVLSENHNIVAKTSKNNLYKISVKDVIEKNNTLVSGFKDAMPVNFEYYGTNEGINLTDSQIRLQIAVCADGTLLPNNKCRINIKKKSKIQRLEWLLNECNVEYRLDDKGEYNNHYYYFEPPVYSKSLYSIFKNCNAKQFSIVAKEVMKWDGSQDGKIFRTTIKEDADFIQFVFACVFGNSSSIIVDDRVGQKKKRANGKEYEIKSICYEVYATAYNNISLSFSRSKGNIEEYVPTDGRMYCFTVPSGMLLLRRNNHIFVTGNCGKEGTKVDRSASYMARYLAKNIVATGICDTCKVELSYMIGVPEPSSINIEMNTNCKYAEVIKKWITENVDLTPYGIMKRFDTTYGRYYYTAKMGHYGFNVDDSTTGLDTIWNWEKLDLVEDLSKCLAE